MLKKLLFVCTFIPSLLLASTFSNVTITGKNFPSEDAFSRRLKADYDIIQKQWSFPDDQTITLQAYHLATQDPIPPVIEFSGISESHFLNKDNVKYINLGIPLAFAAYGALFWDWGKMKTFSFRDEGWFTKNTYAGGTDKLAHMYSHYLINRSSYYMYRQSGLTHSEALKNSFILATSIGLLIEIGDGISHYGFAVNDLIADMAGIGLGHLLNQNAYGATTQQQVNIKKVDV
jgi:hypothetical protein